MVMRLPRQHAPGPDMRPEMASNWRHRARPTGDARQVLQARHLHLQDNRQTISSLNPGRRCTVHWTLNTP